VYYFAVLRLNTSIQHFGNVQFFLEMMRVPRMEAKLRVFSFKILFNQQVTIYY
jgi:hypothetical protein